MARARGEGRHNGEVRVERSEEREGRHKACPYGRFEGGGGGGASPASVLFTDVVHGPALV